MLHVSEFLVLPSVGDVGATGGVLAVLHVSEFLVPPSVGDVGATGGECQLPLYLFFTAGPQNGDLGATPPPQRNIAGVPLNLADFLHI